MNLSTKASTAIAKTPTTRYVIAAALAVIAAVILVVAAGRGRAGLVPTKLLTNRQQEEQRVVSTMPPVISSVRGIEVVSAFIDEEKQANIVVLNNSNKAIQGLAISSGSFRTLLPQGVNLMNASTRIPTALAKAGLLVKICLLTTLLSGLVWLSVSAQTDEVARTLERVPLKNEPVQITEVRTSTKSDISLGQSFVANNDWLSGLTLKVKNVSAKQIVRAELELQFPEVQLNNAVFILPVHYGEVPGLEEPSSDKQAPIGPNETADIKLDNETYDGLKRIAGGNGSVQVTKARIRISTIVFADGTAWHNGFLHIRDPNNPRRWIRVSNNIRAIKTPSHTVGFFDSTELLTW